MPPLPKEHATLAGLVGSQNRLAALWTFQTVTRPPKAIEASWSEWGVPLGHYGLTRAPNSRQVGTPMAKRALASVELPRAPVCDITV